jgi:poly(hydroxyalkanoate) depolymerase family esterase
MSTTTPNGGSAAAPTEPGTVVAAPGRFVDGTFTSDAGTRRWKLWVPSGYDAARRYPLIVMLHGCTQDPDDLARGTRATGHADGVGALVLLPEQPQSANPKKCWNWYDPAHQRRDAGEPALIAGMTRQILGDWAVDPQRVYLAGISAGAAMASVAIISYPDVFAAVALHSGIPFGAASTVLEGVSAMSKGASDTSRLAQLAFDAMGAHARVIPAIIVQGADDPVVRPVNAAQTRDAWIAMNARTRSGRSDNGERGWRRSDSTAGGLAVVQECFGVPTAGECEVKTLLVSGLGHAWSGGSRLGTFTDERGPDATAEIFRFLLAHRMANARATPGGVGQ